MNLLIISHTPHYLLDGVIQGWGSTVREVDHLATLFDQVTHLAPLHSEPTPASSLAYTNPKIHFVPVKPAGGETIFQKLAIFGRIPGWLVAMRKEMLKADAVHIRCPAVISLVALIAYRLWGRGKPCWVKYAGNWQPQRKEPISYTIQRAWLSKNCHHGVVTVNGNWPAQPTHVLPFNNPSLTLKEVQAAAELSKDKALKEPLELIFVGRLEDAKGVPRIIQLAKLLADTPVDFHLSLIGDGPQRSAYQAQVARAALQKRVSFVGWKRRAEINDYYAKAHFILMPSDSEGWPKVLSEAMAFGAVPLASDVSSIPQVLNKTGAGKALPPADVEAYLEAILLFDANPRSWQAASAAGKIAAVEYTYEHYLQCVRKLISTNWNINLTL